MQPIHKKIQKLEEYFIQFTDEESTQLGIKEGDKFEFVEDKDGFLLKKFAELDIDLAEFDRDTLEFLVAESCRTHLPVEEVIGNILTEAIDREEAKLEAIRAGVSQKKKTSLKNITLDTPENL